MRIHRLTSGSFSLVALLVRGGKHGAPLRLLKVVRVFAVWQVWFSPFGRFGFRLLAGLVLTFWQVGSRLLAGWFSPFGRFGFHHLSGLIFTF